MAVAGGQAGGGPGQLGADLFEDGVQLPDRGRIRGRVGCSGTLVTVRELRCCGAAEPPQPGAVMVGQATPRATRLPLRTRSGARPWVGARARIRAHRRSPASAALRAASGTITSVGLFPFPFRSALPLVFADAATVVCTVG